MSLPKTPTMREPRPVTGGWSVLPAWLPVEGLGTLPVNSFLLKGDEPVLVDTGLGALGDPFLDALRSAIDPTDIRWIWLSHLDADHIGNLGRVLAAAPHAEIVTNFLGAGKMGLAGLDVSRVHRLEPGDVLDAGGHRLYPVRPPYYDAPETIGFFDAKDRVFFSADSFGALLPETVDAISELPARVLRDGLIGWSAIDAPWLGHIDPAALGRTLSAIERLDPDIVLSSHLPLARNGAARLTGIIAETYGRGATVSVAPQSVESLIAALE